MARKKKHGGARKGAGRHEVKDKSVGVNFTLKESVIKQLGGKENVRKIAKEAALSKAS